MCGCGDIRALAGFACSLARAPVQLGFPECGPLDHHTWNCCARDTPGASLTQKSGSDCGGGGGAVSRVLGPCILLNLPLLTSSDKEREDLPSGEFIAKGTECLAQC